MGNIKLSIILPMYNVELYIEKCIRSLEEQDIDKNKYEILVIDDGSPDLSASIVEQLQKEYPNIIMYHTTNRGQSSARNYGMEQAKGKYCWFIDADDYIEKNVLKEMLYQLETYNLDYLGFNLYVIKGNIKEQEIGWIHQESSVISGMEYIQHAPIVISPCRHILRTEIYHKYNLRFIDGIIHEDYEFTLRMYRYCAKMKFIELPVYNYVIKSDGTTTTIKSYTQNRYSIRSWKVIIETLEKYCETFSDKYSDYAYIWINTYKYAALTNLLVRALPLKEKKVFYLQYKSSGLFIIGRNHLSFKRKVRTWIYRIPFMYIMLIYLFNKEKKNIL